MGITIAVEGVEVMTVTARYDRWEAAGGRYGFASDVRIKVNSIMKERICQISRFWTSLVPEFDIQIYH